MLPSRYDPRRLQVRALTLRMVASQPTINQSPMSSVFGGILVPMVAQTLSHVGTSMFAFIVPNNTKGNHALAPRGLTPRNNDLY